MIVAAIALLFFAAPCAAQSGALSDLAEKAGEAVQGAPSASGGAVPTGYPSLPRSGCPSRGQFGQDHLHALSALGGCGASSGSSDFDRILRGGAPTKAGVSCLKSLGVTLVVDLRGPGEDSKGREKAWVEGEGLTYLRFPMNTAGGTKSCGRVDASKVKENEASVQAAVKAVRAHLKASPSAKAFVHCARGEDRTGLMLGVYRVQADSCPKAVARSEMRKHYYAPYCALETVWTALP